ncbi:beta-ketoacyl synthase N-terminal-like domain-containing protein [Bacillus mycoides]|uniref:beta-ketoacyl synthase N-terminal-like domain-containing protein n=1 Tax=Bacillus mycoides TaxID=1405 RepID=UPI00339CA11D
MGILIGRLSYFYDFTGQVVTCDAACSSSIATLNSAVDSLREYKCEMAIVNGYKLSLLPESFVIVSKYSGISNYGRYKDVNDTADGLSRGEGGCVIILKQFVFKGFDFD